MDSETYRTVRLIFNALGHVDTSELRQIDRENVEEARKQLAWSLRRWGVEYEDGIPAEAAALAPE